MERAVAERIVRELHTARISGDLDAMCRLFAANAKFRIAGASADKPIVISSLDVESFRPWLSMLVKVFRVSHYRMLSFVFEENRASVHWRADIFSKVTGVTVLTELVDLIEFGDERITSYCEFFVPCYEVFVPGDDSTA